MHATRSLTLNDAHALEATQTASLVLCRFWRYVFESFTGEIVNKYHIVLRSRNDLWRQRQDMMKLM